MTWYKKPSMMSRKQATIICINRPSEDKLTTSQADWLGNEVELWALAAQDYYDTVNPRPNFVPSPYNKK